MYKILVADDEINITETIKEEIELLLDNDVNISVAANGLDALNLALKTKYDLIISDYNMPILNGVQFITSAKSAENLPNAKTPVIFLSGFIQDVKKAFGMLDTTIYISKPYNPKSFHRSVKNLLNISEE